MGFGGMLKRVGKWVVKTIIREAKEEIAEKIEEAVNPQDERSRDYGSDLGIPRK